MFSNQHAQSAYNNNKFENFSRGCGNFRSQKFGKHLMPWMRQFTNPSNIPVNIEETEGAYYIYVYAAGLLKENFTISFNNGVLSISYKAVKTSNENRFSHQEYSVENFERLFKINNTVLTDSIIAAYAEGILKVTLPKNMEEIKPLQKVTVN